MFEEGIDICEKFIELQQSKVVFHVVKYSNRMDHIYLEVLSIRWKIHECLTAGLNVSCNSYIYFNITTQTTKCLINILALITTTNSCYLFSPFSWCLKIY